MQNNRPYQRARRGVTLLAPLLAITLLTGCGSAPEASFSDARAAFKSHDYSTARIHLLNLLDQDSNDIAANTLYARTMLELGDGDSAQAALDRLIDIEGETVASIAMQAHADIVRGKADAAIARLYAIADEEWDAQIYRMAIWAHMENETLAEQPDLVANALSRYQKSADLHALVARIGVTYGDWDVARQAMGNALTLDPDHYEALLIKAEIAIRDDALETAKTIYAGIAKRYPDQGVPPTNIAGLEIDLGNLDAAEALIARTEQAHPNYTFLQFQKARLAHARGDYRRAYNILQSMPGYVHDYAPGLALNAVVAEELGNREVAIARLERLLTIIPGDSEAMERLDALQL